MGGGKSKNKNKGSNKSRHKHRVHHHSGKKQAKFSESGSGSGGGGGGGGSISGVEQQQQQSGVLLPPPFPAHLPKPPGGKFMYGHDPAYHQSFRAAVDGPYEGFVVDKNVLTLSSSSSSASASSDRSSTTAATDSGSNRKILSDEDVQRCLDDEMNSSRLSYFQTDVTQPFGLGTKCAKTYVTRCLVGEPGTTYKYLGLRMFSHPWTSSSSSSSSSSNLSNSSVTNLPENTIKKLGDVLSSRTKTHLRSLYEKRQKRLSSSQRHYLRKGGSSNFDICLINRMEPRHEELKLLSSPSSGGKDNMKNSGGSATTATGAAPPSDTDHDDILRTSVSWHADSSLENYSTIAVYQTLIDNDNNGKESNENDKNHYDEDSIDSNWMVGLRVVHHTEGPTQSLRRGTAIESSVVTDTPQIAVSLPNRSAYYLLDDFNHHHQHAVILKQPSSTISTKDSRIRHDAVRYSCTFRLLRESHNVHDWITRGKNAARQFHKKGLKLWRSEQLLLTEIESEWLRQFYIQGSKHKKLLWDKYWKEPIVELLKIWSQLERRTYQTIEFLRLAVEGKCFDNDYSYGSDEKMTNNPGGKMKRKLRERQKKALAAFEELITRSGNDDKEETKNIFDSLAILLEERATMREFWKKREKDHVFHEMPSDCQPLEISFQFNRPLDEMLTMGVGLSVMQGEPSALREIANGVRMLWNAFDKCDAKKLPDLSLMTPPTAVPHQHKNENPRDCHSKSIEWSGWGETHRVFGLELQAPFAGAVVDGTKSVETRLYDIPPALLGKKIWILQSPTGKAGVSSLGNTISDFSQTKVIGWCKINSVKKYMTAEAFEADESLHLVSPSSGYGWRRNETKIIYGWVVSEFGSCHDTSNNSDRRHFESATRRMRSLFELQPKFGETANTTYPKIERHQKSKRSHKKSSGSTNEHNAQKNKKKKRRY